MPRETKRQLPRSGTRDLQGRLTAGSLRPTAGASGVPYAAPAKSDATHLAEALQAFSPGLSSVLLQQQQELNKEAAARGEAAVATDNLSREEVRKRIADRTLHPHESPYFQKAYAAGLAMREGQARGRQLMEQYIANPEADVVGMADAAIKEDLQGMDSPEYVSTYTGVMNDWRNKIANKKSEYNANRVKENTLGIHSTVINSALDDLVERRTDYNPEQFSKALYETIHLNQKDGRDFLNLSYPEMEAKTLEAVASVAMRELDPTLLDVFKQPTPDGTPSLYSRDQHKIDGLQQAIVRAAKAERSKKNDELTFAAMLEGDKLVQDDSVTEALMTKWATQQVAANTLQPGAAHGFIEKWRTEDDKRKTKRLVDTAIFHNDARYLAVAAEQKDGKDLIGESWTKHAAEALDDPKRGMPWVINKGKALDLIVPTWKHQLNSATPSNAAGFVRNANLFKQIKDGDAVYAQRHVDDRNALMYDVYWNSISAGDSEQEALETVRQVGDTESVRQARRDLGAYYAREGADAVRAELTDMPGLFTGNVANTQYVVDQVQNTATARIARGNTSPEAAVAYAVERFKARHTAIGNHWVYNGGRSIPDTTVAALNSHLTDVHTKLLEQGNISVDSDNGVYLDMNNSSFADPKGVRATLRYTLTGLPVPGYADVYLHEVVAKNTAAYRKDIAEQHRRIQAERSEPDDFQFAN